MGGVKFNFLNALFQNAKIFVHDRADDADHGKYNKLLR